MAFHVVVALAMIAGSLWAVIGPQLPVFRSHRASLAWLTWAGTRGAYLLVLTQATGLLPAARWLDFLAVAGRGAISRGAIPATGSIDAAAGGAWATALVLGLDFLAWRSLAAAEGDAGEAAWSWVASPLVLWVGIACGAPRGAAVALVALAWMLLRRGRETAAGCALGAVAMWGGPAGLAAALALALAPGRKVARVAGALVTGGAAFAALHAFAPAVWGWSWLPPQVAGGGVTLWRLAHEYTGMVPAAWTWLPCVALVLAGFAVLARGGAGSPALGAWAFAAFAALAPAFPVRSALPLVPLIGVWAADDPDRSGWWFLESLALAVAVLFDGIVLRGQAGLSGRLIAQAGVAAAVLLALWPLLAALRAPLGLAGAKRA